jgi:hypothetical protein
MATGTSGARCSSAAALVAAAGLCVACEQGRRGGFYSRAQVEAVRNGLVTPRNGMGAGRGTAATCSGRQANGGARAVRCGQRARTTWLGVGPTDIAHRDQGAQRTDLWTRAGLGMRVRRRTAAGCRDRARRRARGVSARSGAKIVRFSPV